MFRKKMGIEAGKKGKKTRKKGEMDIGVNPRGWGIYPPTFDKRDGPLS